MKIRYFLLLLSIAVINTYAQTTYTPLISDSKKWSYLYSYNTGTDLEQHSDKTRIFSFDRDSIIDGKNYKLLISDWNIQATEAYREDVVNKKVYVRSLFDVYTDMDFLLYDFSVEKGDSIEALCPTLYSDSQLKNLVVINTYYKPIGETVNPLKHIELQSCSSEFPKDTLVWIEGIGNAQNEHVVHNLSPSGTGSLMCVSENDILLYKSDLGNKYNCFVDTTYRTALNIIENGKYNIYIKNNILTIESIKVIKVSLYNLQGKQVLSTTQTSIDISQFITGVYLVVVQTDSEIYSKKIVVK